MSYSVGKKSISASKRNLTICVTGWHDGSITELGNLLLKTVKNCCWVIRLTISPQCPAIFIPFLWGRLLPHLGHCIDYLGACFVVPSSPSVKTPLLCSGPSPVCQRCPVFDHCIAPKVQCRSLRLRGPSFNWRGPNVGCWICAVSLDCPMDTASCGRGIYERDHRCGDRICCSFCWSNLWQPALNGPL